MREIAVFRAWRVAVLAALHAARIARLSRVERRLACLLCVLGLASLLAAGTASAADPVLPLGTDGHGIHLTAKRVGKPPHRTTALVLTFDDSAADRYRQVAGRYLDIECDRLMRGRAGIENRGGGGSVRRAPRHRRPIVVLRGRMRFDTCSIGVQRHRRMTIVAQIPLTRLGAEYLDARATTTAVVAAVQMLARPDRPSAAVVAARFQGVVLAAPTETPPPGVLGVYSDGGEHVYAARSTLAGKLLFVEMEGDVTRSNVLDALINPDSWG